MLKTTLQITNGSSSKINCISVGATIRVPALSTSNKVVDEAKAEAIKTALAARYPALSVTDLGDFDDGVVYPYMPFLKNKLIATVGPAFTDDSAAGYSVGSVWINTTSNPKDIYQCVDASVGAAVWRGLTTDTQPFAEKTPVNAVAAGQTFTAQAGGSTITDASTVTIGAKTYTFKTALTPTEGQVLIGANDTASLLNLKNAINHTGTPDTDYKFAAVHPTVTGVSSNATTLVVAAKTKGVAGNAIATAKTGAGTGSWGAATLAGGVDGTVGGANETCADGSYIYHAIAENTIADANWRRMSLGSAY